MNPMKQIRIDKIVLNIGCATKVPVDNAKVILEMISQRKAVITKTKKRSTFNVPKSKPIGCMVTVRKGSDEFLRKLLVAKENSLKAGNFDSTGNFSFGIREYIDIPGTDYDSKIGILGLDVSVALERLGYRVKRKKIPSKVGKNHMITKNEAIDFVRNQFGVTVE